MNILLITPRYHPHIGGVETHVKSIAERLVKRGYQVDVYATDPEGTLPKREDINGVAVRRFRSFAPGNAYYLPTIDMLNAIKGSDADIVHAHNIQAFPMLYACIAKQKEKHRLVLTMHTGASSRFRNMLLPLYLRLVRGMIADRADAIICVSEFEKRVMVSRLRVNASKVSVIPNGIEEDIFHVKRMSDGFNILSVGRLERFKNFDKVIEALHILHKRYALKDARLTIVGNGPDRERLRAIVERLDLSRHVTFRSNLSRDKLLQEYARARVFVLASEYESYGIAAVEAIAMGIPAVVSNGSALVEFAECNAAVGIDPPVTGDKVAEAILLAENFKPADAMERIMTWDEVVSRLEGIYRKLVTR